MNKLLVVLTILYLCSCQMERTQPANIEYIKVYEFPAHIVPPIAMDEKSIRLIDPYRIEDENKLDSIQKFIEKLQPYTGEYEQGSLIIASDFYFDNRDKRKFLYDGGYIVFDGAVYFSDTTLIQIILENQ